MDAEDDAVCSTLTPTETSKLLDPIQPTTNCNNASNVGLLSDEAVVPPRLSLSESEEDVLNGNKSPVPGIADVPNPPESPKILEAEPDAEAAIKQVDDTKNGNSPAKEGWKQQEHVVEGISLSSSLEEQLSSSTAADDYKAHTSSFSFYDSSKLSASASSDDTSIPLDSSLADFEDAALRYASLSMSRHNSEDGGGIMGAFTSARLYDNNDDSIFLVQSRGWLPMEKISSDPRANSASVEACIQHLSRSHGQILDGVGAWGHGKDMLLTIEEEHLKLLDPSTQVELHSQLIKQIKIWGVGHDNNSDFAFVAKDTADRSKPVSYKCHVFRCEDCGPSIAEQLHLACTKLSKKAKQQKALADDNKEKEKLALATPIPKPVLVTKDFNVIYLGSEKVSSFTGMDVVKDVIRNVTTNDVALCLDAVISVSNAAVVVKGTADGKTIVHCRIRCLSFMGLGDDFSLFGFVSVVGSNGVCHVLQCHPTAFNLCLSVQEACCIRYQKAVDSSHDRPSPHDRELSTSTAVSRRFSFRRLMTSVFNGGRSAVRRTASSSSKSGSNNGGSQLHLS